MAMVAMLTLTKFCFLVPTLLFILIKYFAEKFCFLVPTLLFILIKYFAGVMLAKNWYSVKARHLTEAYILHLF